VHPENLTTISIICDTTLFIDKLLIEMDVMWEDQQSKFQLFFGDVLVKHFNAVPIISANYREIITFDPSPLIECGDVFIEPSTEKWLLKKYFLSKKEIKETLQNSITNYADLKPIFKSEDESIPF
jgi:hypothetical protein